jgi:hypothetical protein
MSNRAATDGRAAPTAARTSRSRVITGAAPLPAAAAKCPVPGRARRQDPPGVRPQPGDWRGQLEGYLPAGSQDNHGPDVGADGAPCSVPPRRPRPGSPRSRSGPARRRPRGPAGARSADGVLICCTAMVNSVRRLIRAWAGSISDACRIRSRPRRSGAQPRAPLLPARGEHRPPGPGTHAQAEPVLPRATAIVRLKSTLAHFGLQMRCLACRARLRHDACRRAPHDACRRASGTTLMPHRPGSRISTAPARWPVNQGMCRDPRRSNRYRRPGDCPRAGVPGARCEPAGYRNTAIYRTRRKRDA